MGTTTVRAISPREAMLLTRLGHYTSTYCLHGKHVQCRLTCKHCQAPCRCSCHIADRPLVEVLDDHDADEQEGPATA